MAGLKALISYYFYRTIDLDRLVAKFAEPPLLFADSGAFSALTQGASIDLDDYIAWVRRWRHRFVLYANLDVVGSPGVTALNQRRMEEAGLSPVPAFHAGSDFRVLEELCERYPLVGLGGMVQPTDKDAVMRWLVSCFKIAARYGAGLHGYGQGTDWILRALPFYSVDTSSWTSGHRWGRVNLWSDEEWQFLQVKVGDWKDVYAHADLIRRHGIDPVRLADRREYRRAWAIATGALAWARYEQFLRRRHGPVRLRDPVPPGLHLFLVDSDPSNLEAAGLHLFKATVPSDITLMVPGTRDSRWGEGEVVGDALSELGAE